MQHCYMWGLTPLRVLVLEVETELVPCWVVFSGQTRFADVHLLIEYCQFSSLLPGLTHVIHPYTPHTICEIMCTCIAKWFGANAKWVGANANWFGANVK